jgi:hypothetical protein
MTLAFKSAAASNDVNKATFTSLYSKGTMWCARVDRALPTAITGGFRPVRFDCNKICDHAPVSAARDDDREILAGHGDCTVPRMAERRGQSHEIMLDSRLRRCSETGKCLGRRTVSRPFASSPVVRPHALRHAWSPRHGVNRVPRTGGEAWKCSGHPPDRTTCSGRSAEHDHARRNLACCVVHVSGWLYLRRRCLEAPAR